MIDKTPDIKRLYTSNKDDIANDFYNKCFDYFSNYDRVSAYFDSNILYLYSKGLEKLLKNNGKIRFIFSHQITEEDFDLILKGYNERVLNTIDKELVSKLIDLDDNIDISNLSYLIKIGVVDVKIALTKAGIFHDKFGLFYNEKNTVLFRGSANETKAAIEKNYDSFETTTSWNDPHTDIIKIRRENFDNLWGNVEHGVQVIDVPELLRQKLLEFDKGKIIIKNYGTNSIILDYHNEFFAENNLENREDLNENNFYFKHVKHFIKKQIDNKYFFNDDNNYIKIKRIINYFEKFAINNNLEIYITEKLKTYLIESQYDMDYYAKIGTAIKKNEIKKSNIDFNKFIEILKRDMLRELREPQFLSAFHLSSLKKASNFSVPGSGKTSIVYGMFAYYNSNEINLIDKIVVIGPLNSFTSWTEEFNLNFGDKKDLNVFNITNYDNKTAAIKYDIRKKNLVLINYEILQTLNNNDLIKDLIDNRTLLVFDEVHRIKNTGGIRAGIALKLSQLSNYKVMLTGTPLPNGYEDIYNILNMLYDKEYEEYFKLGIRALKKANENKIEAKRVNELINPFFMRTTKKQLSIPEPNDDDIVTGYIELNDMEEKINSIIYRCFSGNYLELYIRLLQASINPSFVLKKLDLVEDEKESIGLTSNSTKTFYSGLNSVLLDSEKKLLESQGFTRKFEAGIDLIEQLVNEGKQVIVWAVFKDTIKGIKEYLDAKNIKNEIVFGETDYTSRNEIIDDFKKTKINVLISNPHTLGESVSLHKTCHDAIYFEYTFNLTHMLQSKDRINRLGLENDQYTQYYFLMFNGKNTDFNFVDLKTYYRLKEKEDRMLNAIESDGDLEYIRSNSVDEDLDIIFNRKNKII